MTRAQPSVAASLLPLATIVFTGFLCIGIPLPALTLHVHGTLGFDAGTVGWVIGIQSFATILTRQYAGAFCDRHGPRRAVLVGLPMAIAASLLYLASTFMASPATSLMVLVLGRLLMGPAESLFLTGTMTWGIGRLGAQRTGVVMAWQGIAMFAALGLGGPVGVALQQQYGFAGVAIVTAMLPLVGLCVAYALPRFMAPARVAGVRVGFKAVLGLIGRYGTALALSAMPMAILNSFVVLFFASRQWNGAGFAILCFAAGYIGPRLFLAHLADRIGGIRVGAVSVVLELLGQALLWQADSPTAAYAGALLTGIGFSLVFPAMGVEAMARVPPHARGVAVGSFMAFVDLATGLTGPIVGLMIGLQGYPSAFIMGGVACVLAMGLMLTAPPRTVAVQS
jgi:MFS family permease